MNDLMLLGSETHMGERNTSVDEARMLFIRMFPVLDTSLNRIDLPPSPPRSDNVVRVMRVLDGNNIDVESFATRLPMVVYRPAEHIDETIKLISEKHHLPAAQLITEVPFIALLNAKKFDGKMKTLYWLAHAFQLGTDYEDSI